MQGIDLRKNYIGDKNLYNNVPKFDKMMARPLDNGSPLPIYMQGTASRESIDMTTENSLKMNNYSNGKYIDGYSACAPKKSFNKVVNLNLLNSKSMFSDLLKKKKNMNYIEKSLRFYNKNYKDLMKDGQLTKFDNVTFKAIPNNFYFDPKYTDATTEI